MKRYNHLIDKVATKENVDIADMFARRNKKHSKPFIEKHDLHKDEENNKLVHDLKNGTYKTSRYYIFKIYEPKERTIYRLPYYPDRIAHHSLMNVLEEIWTKQFIRTTYSCIRGRGIHKCLHDVSKTLNRYPEETVYCFKLDIKKFYPSINLEILKQIIRRKIKDKKLLTVLDEIIDSIKATGDTKGVPIGNYLSQFFANLYLTSLDIACKQELKCKLYVRYADDIVILNHDKEYLHKVLIYIKLYLKHVLDLEVKSNYRIFPVEKCGINFVGYRIYHNRIYLRKSIKLKMLKLFDKYMSGEITYDEFHRRMPSYFGWLKYSTDNYLKNYILSNLKYRE